MGSSGSGSAGGGSAATDYPTYMKNQHEIWMGQVSNDMAIARAGGSPFADIEPFDPSEYLNNMMGEGGISIAAEGYDVASFYRSIIAMAFCDDWKDMVDCAVDKIDTAIVDEATADANIDAYADLIDDQLTAEVLPRFEAGMVDINSVISSAFVIGRALIEDGRDKAVVKYGTDLKLQNYKQRNEMITSAVEVMKGMYLQKMEFLRAYIAFSVEANRIGIVSQVEFRNQTADFADRDSRWDLEVYQYGSNIMASIAGGAVSTDRSGPSQSMSALGGALSGAAAGTMIAGPGWGTAIGAGVGFAMSYM